MNLILVAATELDERGRVALRDRRAQHIRAVLGAQPGDHLRVGVIRGPRGVAVVESIGDPVIIALAASDETPAPSVELVLAMPRPKSLSRTVRAAASLGVARIDIVNAWRVDKSYLASPRLAPATLAEDALLGCEQGCQTWVPDVALHPRLAPFLGGTLAERMRRGARGLICHPRDARFVESVMAAPAAPAHASTDPIIVAIGPDRGWIDREVERFVGLGFSPVRLGVGVLRVEDAVVATLAQLELLARLRITRDTESTRTDPG